MAAIAPRRAGWALPAALVLLGVLLVAVGIVYFAEPASRLPSFFPAHASTGHHHHTKHGILALVLGLLCWLGAWLAAAPRPEGRRPAA